MAAKKVDLHLETRLNNELVQIIVQYCSFCGGIKKVSCARSMLLQMQKYLVV